MAYPSTRRIRVKVATRSVVVVFSFPQALEELSLGPFRKST